MVVVLHRIMYFYIKFWYIFFYTLNAIIPKTKPIIFPTKPIRPLYNLLDSGISSPETMYSIAPAAIAKQMLIIPSDIWPASAPKNAPMPVVIPDNITYKIIINTSVKIIPRCFLWIF